MQSSLVASQFEDLEPLDPDEGGLSVDATLSPVEIVAKIQAHRLQIQARRLQIQAPQWTADTGTGSS